MSEVEVRSWRTEHPTHQRLPYVATATVRGRDIYRYGTTQAEAEGRVRNAIVGFVPSARPTAEYRRLLDALEAVAAQKDALDEVFLTVTPAQHKKLRAAARKVARMTRAIDMDIITLEGEPQ